MAHISQFFVLARALFHAISILGFAAFHYNNAKQSFRAQHLRGRWPLRTNLRRLLYLCLVVVYILARVHTEMQSASFSELTGEALRPLSVRAICEDLLDLYYYCRVCLRLGARQQVLPSALNELQCVVRAVQCLVRERFECPWLLLGLAYLLLGRMALALLCDFGVLWIRSEEYEHWYRWEAIAAVGLTGCNVCMQLHWLCHYLHFALQASLCDSLNAFLQQQRTAKRLRALRRLLHVQPAVQQLQLVGADYFAPSMQYLQLKTLLKFYTFAASLRYDDVTLAKREYNLEIAEELEAEKSIVRPLPPYIAPDLLETLQKVQMVLLLAAWMALLFAAHAYYRERLLFKLNLLDVARVEWAHESRVLDDAELLVKWRHQQPNERCAEVADLHSANGIRSCIPKRHLLDVLLENTLKISDLAHEHVILFKFYFGIEVHVDAALSAVKSLISLLLVMVLADQMQRRDILKLEKMSNMV